MPKPIKKEVRSNKNLESKIEELTADLQRVHADFVNFRRRSEEEQGQIMVVAKQAVISQLLPLLDNLDRALSHIPKELESNSWAEGVAQVAKQSEVTLKELGVEKIQAKGQVFDPHLHEAVGLEDGEGDHEVVAEELQTGYKIGETIIRPAMVKVRKESI